MEANLSFVLIPPTKTFYSVYKDGKLVGFAKDPFEERSTWWIKPKIIGIVDRVVSDRFLIAGKEIIALINSPDKLTSNPEYIAAIKEKADVVAFALIELIYTIIK